MPIHCALTAGLRARRQGLREVSATLLAKGFNIGCLMARYQGLDWRDPDELCSCAVHSQQGFVHAGRG